MLKSVVALLLFCFTCSVINESCLGVLYPNDPLQNSVNLINGHSSETTRDYLVYNYASYLSYDGEKIYIVPEGGRQGTYVNLGTAVEIMNQYNIQDFPSINMYTTLRIDPNTNQYVIGKNYNDVVAIDTPNFPSLASGASFKPEKNDIYLIKGTNTNFTAKLLILDHSEEKLIIRWTIIEHSGDTENNFCTITSESKTYSLIELNGERKKNFNHNNHHDESSSESSSALWITLIVFGVIFIIILLICQIVFLASVGFAYKNTDIFTSQPINN
eukprot:TRINITY_DN15080_c0_g1_i1.p1 TRINITY_DN15080_c0_g1~~TRINITY_DN15080_c0_g1_i1.p1  ORF type:complete len:290 (-),score=73.79 TRINITY_DN15080_c0_g1_i1:145-960(-)